MAGTVLNLPDCIAQPGDLTCRLNPQGGPYCEEHFAAIEMGACTLLQGLKEGKHGRVPASLNDGINERQQSAELRLSQPSSLLARLHGSFKLAFVGSGDALAGKCQQHLEAS